MTDWHDRFAPYAQDMIPVRRHLHAHPELAFEEVETARLVAEKLTGWGYEVTTGVGGTGVVGTLRAGEGNRAIGLRADMDALPIHEASGLPYASSVPGKMHACGHDGHTSMLLGAAKALAESRGFSGVVHLLFQPAEEGRAGARAMMDDGLFDRFPCDEVYALHNAPGVPVGVVGWRDGPTMAANDRLVVTVTGKGGHASQPQGSRDPIVAGSAIVYALQSVVGRAVDPLDAAVVTVGAFRAGEVFNIIPQTAELKISIRTQTAEVRALVLERVREVIENTARAHGCAAEIEAMANPYPPLVNAPEQVAVGRAVAQGLFGEAAVIERERPMMGSEDFAFMLEEKPGAYFFLGNGTEGPNGANVHQPTYDFNDDALLPGIAFWTTLVESRLAPGEAAMAAND